MSQGTARRHGLFTFPNSVVGRDDYRHLAGEAHALAQRSLGGDVGNVCIERRKRRNRSPQHIHRMGVLDHPDNVEDGFWQAALSFELGVEDRESGLGRKFALNQKVGGLLKCGVLGKVVDRVAPIAQLAGLPVDEARRRAVEMDSY